jgi:hypothetical protein
LIGFGCNTTVESHHHDDFANLLEQLNDERNDAPLSVDEPTKVVSLERRSRESKSRIQ